MTIAVVNHATGETIEQFTEHTAEEVETRVQRAQDAFDALKETTYAERGVWMKKAADILESEVPELAKILVVEMGGATMLLQLCHVALYARVSLITKEVRPQ